MLNMAIRHSTWSDLVVFPVWEDLLNVKDLTRSLAWSSSRPETVEAELADDGQSISLYHWVGNCSPDVYRVNITDLYRAYFKARMNR